MARRAVGRVAARVDDVQRDVVRRVDVGRAHHAAVAVDALVAAVAGEAVAPRRGRPALVVAAEASAVARRSRAASPTAPAGPVRRGRVAPPSPASPSAGRPARSGGRRRSGRSPACRRGSRGSSPSSADRRASTSASLRALRVADSQAMPRLACSRWLNLMLGRGSSTRGGSAATAAPGIQPWPAASSGRRRSARAALPAARTALAGWARSISWQLRQAASAGIRLSPDRRRLAPRCVTALAGRAAAARARRDRTRAGCVSAG